MADNREEKFSENLLKPKKKIRFGITLKFSLAIIVLVCAIILTIALFIVYRESAILREQIFNFVNREVVHLSNTTQQLIGYDDLTLSDAVDELKKINFFRYVYVLNNKNEVVFGFNRKGGDYKEIPLRELLNDGVARNLDSRTIPDSIDIVSFKDKESNSEIFDFSKIVYSRKDGKTKVGVVIIGMGDDIIRQEIDKIKRYIIYIFFIFLAVAVLGAIILSAIIIRPIKKLSQGASIIGKGNLDYRIEIQTSDELGQLAEEFNLMTEMIKEAKEKEIETRIMNEQLEIARDIQEGLNPMGFYNKGGIQIKGYTKAAKGVGGDYFDYIDIDENRVGVLISDVSGKGVPASLVMVMIRTVFTTYIKRKDVDCARVVRAINDSLSADFAIDKFATLFFMIYDRRTAELSFSNAGHGPLFCYRASLGECTRTSLDGVPIGIMEDVEYKQARVKLNPGDMVLLYTDGITEMRNPEKEEFGLQRVRKLLLENNHLNANDFVLLLVDSVEKFRDSAPPHDDMTLVCFKRVS
ncbi:MAG TPA: PP2C family protein-serine/threonine phosphatase [Spirochaetota bacterium]|nr:PP2C family protein-serine/threonine phosphatase [Spirochaetota bacterium]